MARLRAHCHRCQLPQLFGRVLPRHGLHLILTIGTLGLWSVSWLAVSIGAWRRPWRCKRCGWHLAPDASGNWPGKER